MVPSLHMLGKGKKGSIKTPLASRNKLLIELWSTFEREKLFCSVRASVAENNSLLLQYGLWHKQRTIPYKALRVIDSTRYQALEDKTVNWTIQGDAGRFHMPSLFVGIKRFGRRKAKAKKNVSVSRLELATFIYPVLHSTAWPKLHGTYRKQHQSH